MPRSLDTITLGNYARQFAVSWIAGHWYGYPERGREWMKTQFHNFTFKDEFDWLVTAVEGHLKGDDLATFTAAIGALKATEPRSDEVFHGLLAERLAIDAEGNHIPGRVGTTKVGGRRLGQKIIEVELPESIRNRKLNGLDKSHRKTHTRTANLDWPVYAGEEAERARIRAGDRDYDDADANPVDMLSIGGGALNTRISNESAIAGLDALLDKLDEGSGAAIIQGYTTAQATDPDTAIGGQTKLFVCVYTDVTAFLGATDGTGKATASADTITDDSSADATGTLAWVRCSASNDGAAALDDHLDGEAGTSGADWTFNTLSIVSGSTVSISSHVVDLSET